MFVEHFNGYYRTEDILNAIIELAERDKDGLGILSAGFIEQQSMDK